MVSQEVKRFRLKQTIISDFGSLQAADKQESAVPCSSPGSR